MTPKKTATAEKVETRAAPSPIKAELVPKDTDQRRAPESAPASGQSDPHRAVQLAIERGADPATVERVIQFARECDDLMEKRAARAEAQRAAEAERAFIRAVTAFKEEPPKITKKSRVDYTPPGKARTFYTYANLDDVVSVVIPAMSKHGLSHRWIGKQERVEGQPITKPLITVTCILQHVDGHSERSELFGFPDESGNKNPVQAVQSTISYLQRYTLLGLLGLSTGDDDDAGGGLGAPQMNDEDARKLDGFMMKLDEASFLDQLRDVRKEAILAYGTSSKLPAEFSSKYEGLRTDFERKQREGTT